MAPEGGAAARGGLALALLQGAGKVAAFGFVVVATRRVGPEAFGRYAIVASLLVFANFLADFGTSAAVVRMVSRDASSSEAVLRGSALASLGLGCASAGIFLGFVHLAPYSTSTQVDATIGLLAVPGQSLLGSVLAAFDGRGAIAMRARLGFLQSAVIAAGGAIAVAATGNVRPAIVALAAAPWAVLAVSIPISRRRRYWTGVIGFDRSMALAVIRLAVPFALSGAVVALSLRFDVLLLSIVRDREETAVYELALRLIEGAAVVGSAVAAAATFVLNRRLAAGDVDGARRGYQETARLVCVGGLLVSSVIAGLAAPIVSAAFGPRYDDVAMPLAVLGSVQWLSFLIQLEGALVNSRDDLVRSTLVAVGCLSSTIALDLVLVPPYGVAGAAIANVSGILVTVIGLDIYHRRTLAIALPFPPWGALAAFAAATVAGLVVEAPLGIALLLVVAVYLAVAWPSRAIDAGMIERARALLARPA